MIRKIKERSVHQTDALFLKPEFQFFRTEQKMEKTGIFTNE